MTNPIILLTTHANDIHLRFSQCQLEMETQFAVPKIRHVNSLKNLVSGSCVGGFLAGFACHSVW